MDGEFERDAARGADALADALCQLKVMPVAGREVGAGLGDADDRLARLQLLPGQAEIEVALDIDRSHARIFRIVEPGLRAQPALAYRAAARALAVSCHRILALLIWPGECPCESAESMWRLSQNEETCYACDTMARDFGNEKLEARVRALAERTGETADAPIEPLLPEEETKRRLAAMRRLRSALPRLTDEDKRAIDKAMNDLYDEHGLPK